MVKAGAFEGILSYYGKSAFVFFFTVWMIFISSGELFAIQRTAEPALQVVIDKTLGGPSLFGADKLFHALNAKGYIIEKRPSLGQTTAAVVLFLGTSGSKDIGDLVKKGQLVLSDRKEGFAIKRIKRGEKLIIVISGADDRGLMYALLQAAAEIEHSNEASPIHAVTEVSETPHVPVRSMAVFLHNQDDEKEWYYSKQYWEDYFGMLAANRWNTFNLVFSHQTPYLAPMYPFHVSVEKYPNVKANNLTNAGREKNLEMLRFISSLARDRGIDFTLGVWQQIAWETGDDTEEQESMISGYNRENMTDYTYLALKKLLRECPGITGLQLRLNYESGVDYESQTAFFKDAVFRASKESGRKILIEVRDIGLLSETLEAAQATGLPTRISHKYWAEDMVFPYHPSKFVWTYSYGDWLKYPRKADHIYQVWSLGSHRLLLWGDPDFARRFAPTTLFGDAVGFEICAPLSQKGFGNAPGAWRIFKEKEREYYQWEFERYWSYYLLLGRLSYNPDADPNIWTQELARRFGAEASDAIANAYRSASQVVPLVVAVAISNFNQYVWPEEDTGGLLNYYLTLRPFDRALFSGFEEHAENILSGRPSGKLSPETVAHRLDSIALETVKSLDKAGTKIHRGEKEFWATDKDFRILSGMAKYFARKMRAAVRLALFYRTGDINQLDMAVEYAQQGLSEWKRLSDYADEIYISNLVFGPGSMGHWKEKTVFVEDDLKQLQYQRELFSIVQYADFAFDFGPAPFTRNTETYSTSYTNDFTVERRFTGVFPNSLYDPRLGYGWIQGEHLKASMAKDLSRYTWSGARAGEAQNIPGEGLMGDYISGEGEAVFRVDLPDGHYQGTVILTDKSENRSAHGPMEVFVVERFGDRPIVDSQVIRVGETVIKRFNINMTGERFINFRVKFKSAPGAHFIVNALTFAKVEPHIAHVPVGKTAPGRDLEVAAGVTLPPPPNDEHSLTSLGIITSNASTLEVPEEIVRVTLKYSYSPKNPFARVDMHASQNFGYKGLIPGKDFREGKMLYFFEAEDNTGRVTRLPETDAVDPYFKIVVTEDHAPPSVSHSPVKLHAAGQPLRIHARVTDRSAVEKVLLYFRPTRQTMEYTVLTMEPEGEEYVGVIPGSAIVKDFNLMYYFEVFDEHGNACISPDREVESPYFVVSIQR